MAAPLAAQTAHNSNAPIDFGADTIELQDKANRAVLSGKRQCPPGGNDAHRGAHDGLLHGPGDRRKPAGLASRRERGGVTVKRPDQTAKAQYAIYDLNRRVITMLGAVTLTQGGNTVNGGR